MKPRYIHIEPKYLEIARHIINAPEQWPKKQAWICSNCGLKRTFHRVSRTHRCPDSNNRHGIWRRAEFNDHPRISILPPDQYVQSTDYLVTLRTNVLVISMEEPQPFSPPTWVLL